MIFMRATLFITILAVLVLGACGTQGTSDNNTTDSSRVLATVDDTQITEQMLKDELDMIPPYQRASFETPEGRRLLLNHIVERELLLTAAIDLELEEDSFVIAQVELAMQQVKIAKERALIQTFYQQEVVDAIVIPDDKILEYYNEHSGDIYRQEAQVKVSQILLTLEDDTAAVKTALEAGDSFETVVLEMSKHEPTVNTDGDMGWITINSPLPYLGEQSEISEALFATEVGEVIGPYSTIMGYHFFLVTDKKEEGVRPLEEVRESIENVLKPAMVNSFFQDDLLPRLRERYGVEINEDAFLPDEEMPADSLLQSAQNLMETNPETAVEYFKLFIERFPEHERAHQAQFLIGFTYSEQIANYDSAVEAFQAVIDNYPESDFVDDAEWMIQNMGVPPEELLLDQNPELNEENTEDSVE
jgi:parvulin-like peptidyl-prolyl isomerase